MNAWLVICPSGIKSGWTWRRSVVSAVMSNDLRVSPSERQTDPPTRHRLRGRTGVQSLFRHAEKRAGLRLTKRDLHQPKDRRACSIQTVGYLQESARLLARATVPDIARQSVPRFLK